MIWVFPGLPSALLQGAFFHILPIYAEKSHLDVICSRADRMSNEHARTENKSNSVDLKARDKTRGTGFLAGRLSTRPWIGGSVHFLTLKK